MSIEMSTVKSIDTSADVNATMSTVTSEPPSFDRVLDLLRLLSRLNHELESTSASMSARLGVTAQQRMIVRTVGRLPGISAGRLAEILCVDPATMSTGLARLERRGLLTRERDPRDRRRTAVYLTPKGRALDVPASGTVESAIAAVLAATSDEDVEHARRLLDAIATRLRAQLAPIPSPSPAVRGKGGAT